jgi:hypothetical protein
MTKHDEQVLVSSKKIPDDYLEKQNKNKGLLIIEILIIICILIGVSYAFWSSNIIQNTSNKVNTNCLKLTLTDESDAINLQSAYPISDSEAEALSPYEFTIKNTCFTSVDYNITLEIMDNADRLNSEYIAVSFNNKSKKLLNKFISVTPTYSDNEYTAVEARKLTSATLSGNSKVTYSIKLWMDESVTSEDSMNKIFLSKISVAAIQEQEKVTLADYIKTLAKTDTKNLVSDDETEDHNIRYIGADPDNYLCFDEDCTNGKWRVIGLMNNMATAKGTQSLVKIIKAESVGSIGWDNSETYGVNDWTTSTLQENLNSGDLYSTYIKDYNNLFETVTWNLGGTASYINNSNGLASHWYTYERGDTVYTNRPTIWTGKIGLMYLSDYGYATSGGSTTDRKTCLSAYLSSWSDSTISDCKNNDFLYLGSNEWSITPYSNYLNIVFILYSTGTITTSVAAYSRDVLPVGYLVSNIKILSGNGSSENPWIVGTN